MTVDQEVRATTHTGAPALERFSEERGRGHQAGAAPTNIVIGIDPGARTTGIVVRQGGFLLGEKLIVCGPLSATAEYLTEILAAVDKFRTDHDPQYDDRNTPPNPPTVAVEGLNQPKVWMNGKRQMLSPDSLMATAAVLGAVQGRWPDAIVVPPGRHGQLPKRLYPPLLWGAREGAAGTGRKRHLRSAWDVAGAAMRLMEVRSR